MVFDYFEKYIFLCEMYNEEADVIIDVTLNFFPFDNSVQVINPKKGKNLLRRVQLPSLTMDMLQVGNMITIFSQLLLIKDSAPVTKRKLFNNVERTFAMIKPCPPTEHGKIITFIMKKGFRIVRLKNAKVDKDFTMELYQNVAGSDILPIVIDYIMSGEVIGLELEAPEAVNYWRKCLGATDPAQAEPGTLRRMCGESILKNTAHGCATPEGARRAIDWFFGYENGCLKVPFRSTLHNCTCCVIKPHAIIEGHLGDILEHINTSNKFYVSAMAMFVLKLHDAREFYEVYKGIFQYFEDMYKHLAEGSCVALEVKCLDPKMNVVDEFRKMCGPRDPEMCRKLCPNSLRALYGKDVVHNGVHCTDLEEDAVLEVEYLFKLLTSQ